MKMILGMSLAVVAFQLGVLPALAQEPLDDLVKITKQIRSMPKWTSDAIFAAAGKKNYAKTSSTLLGSTEEPNAKLLRRVELNFNPEEKTNQFHSVYLLTPKNLNISRVAAERAFGVHPVAISHEKNLYEPGASSSVCLYPVDKNGRSLAMVFDDAGGKRLRSIEIHSD